ncbi:MAG: Plug domain-containing protein, partial [Neisseriaceae bacterium]|nr:Plug domain-containing protein [Neisseriaceae bacterium]
MKNAKLSAITLSLISIFSTAAYAEIEQQTVSRVALSDNNHAQMAAENVRNEKTVSGSLNNVDLSSFNIEQSYDLNNHAVLLAENTVTETATDAQSPAQEVLSGSTNNDETPVAETTNTANATELPSITVKGERKIKPTERYQHTINRTQIEHSASGNGDIGTMLRSLPNVQFDNAQRSSKTPGEIDPADISISGGQHYQNLFLLDGVSINTDLDPANKSAYYWGLPPGRSQGMNVNVDLLDSIKVLDSNVGARYSGFNGGVVIAETRKPEKDFGFQISHQYTNGNIDKGFPHSLTKYHIYGDEAELDSFKNSWSKNNQPLFYKHITKMSAESVINDEWSVIGQFNRTYSKIPLRLHTDTHKNTIGGYNETESNPIDPANMDKIKQNQERYSYNAFIKAYYDPSPDLGFELSYAYMPDWSREYMVAAKDFFYDTKHGGHQLTGKMKWNND